MSLNYQEFEASFIKGAEELNVDPDFLRGYLKYAQELTDGYAEIINEAEKQDPQIRVKLAHDILITSPKVQELLKTASGWEDIKGRLDQMMGQVGQGFGGYGKGFGGAVLGGGGGALIGLLLAKLLGFEHPLVGMLLGGIGGAGLGYGYGNGNFLTSAGTATKPKLNTSETTPKALPGTPGTMSDVVSPPPSVRSTTPPPPPAPDPLAKIKARDEMIREATKGISEAGAPSAGEPVVPPSVRSTTPPPPPAPTPVPKQISPFKPQQPEVKFPTQTPDK